MKFNQKILKSWPTIILFALLVIVFIYGPNFIKGSYDINPLGVANMQKAPKIGGIAAWINSKPLTIEDLHGKVVLIDFWTYSCINCIRTLPYLKAWYRTYGDKGLVIIGVHTPEFEFEKNYDNVKSFVQQNGIEYPIAMDNDYVTWKNYNNNYWPREFLIDANGNVRHDHIGEGGYSETEDLIRQLLKEANSNIGNLSNPVNVTEFNPNMIQTPEIYLGYKFARQNIGNSESFQPEKVVDYQPVNISQDNTVYMEGSWKNNQDNIELIGQTGKVSLVYSAKSINIVAGGNATLEILVDGKTDYAGQDVINTSGKNVVNVSGFRLYNIANSADYGKHLVQIVARGDLMLYTFTFG